MNATKKGSWLLRLLRGYRLYNRYTLILLAVILSYLVYHFWYSLSVTSNLTFPAKSEVIVLAVEEVIVVERGVLDEEYGYVLRPGNYVEVLRNERGRFYLAPPKGFYKTARLNNGLAVGGVYVPSEDPEHYYIWELPLKNEERSFDNASPSRVLLPDCDQPERRLMLDPNWYITQEFGIFEGVLIDTDFKITSDRFR